MLGYDPNSTAYQRAAAAVDRAFGGNDPTEGATHFYSPVSQQALGRLPPPWARGEPIVIGGHNFYAPEGRVAAAQSASQPASQPTPQAVSTAGMFDERNQSQTAFSQRFQGEGEPPPNQALATALETKAASLRPGKLARALEPITSYPKTYGEMNQAARAEMAAGAARAMDPNATLAERGLGAGQAALGGVSYAMSPINAAYRTVVGQPIENITGVPKEYTEFAAQLATPGLGLKNVLTPAPKPPAGIAAGVPTFNQLKDAYVSGKNSSIVENVRIDPSDAAQQIRTIKSALDAKDFSKEGGAAKTLALLDRQESKL